MQQRVDLQDFSRRRRAGDRENTRPDDDAHSQKRKAPRPERLLEPPCGSSEDAIRSSMLLVRKRVDM